MVKKHTRRKTDQRLPLPSVVSPTQFRCLPVSLPYDENDPAVYREWLATFTGQLDRLGYRFNWQHGETDGAYQTARTWRGIVNQIQEASFNGDSCALDQPDENESCIEIGAFHHAIEYWPNHPILTPDYYADPYTGPVWQTGAGQPFLTGNDAFLNPLRIVDPIVLTEYWSVGLPSIRLNFNGAGTIRVKFVDQVQGGLVWMFPDGNFLLGDLENLNHIDITDIADLPTVLADLIELLQGQPINEVDHEFTFETGGDHTLTMWFIPLGEEPPYTGYGGGLRSISLCGEITLVEDVVMPYTMQIDGCNLSLVYDGVPVSTVQVQTPEPACNFESTVTVNNPGNGNNDYYVLEGGVGGSPNNERAYILWNMASGIGFAPSVRLNGGFVDHNNTASGSLEIEAFVNGTSRNVATFNASSRALELRADPDLGHTQIARFVQSGGGLWVNSQFLVDVFNGQRLFAVRASGRIESLYAHTDTDGTSAATVTAARLPSGGTLSGFGFSEVKQAWTSTSATETLGRMSWYWANAVQATRQGGWLVEVYAQSTGLKAIQVEATPNNRTAIGVHGNFPIEQPIVNGSTPATALNSLLNALDSIGWIDNQSPVIEDTGSGGGVGVATQILVTEVYRDFAQAAYTTFSNGTGYGNHAPTFGLVPGSNGFRMSKNYDSGRRLLRVRAQFEADFIVGQTVTLGINLSGTFPRIIAEAFIEPSYPDGTTYIFEGPALVENSSVIGIQLWVAREANDYIPSSHGSITWKTLDLRFEGLANQEADTWDTIYPFGVHRVVKWVDSIGASVSWSEVPGGVIPPALIVQEQT